MPNLDGTGPDGKGPMTGCGRGKCIIPISNSEQELDFLTNQAQVLEKQLKTIKSRINRVKVKKEVQNARI
ncbi:MAG: DUF5320 domain-containing protein [Dehalococcoidales bacterium]|nr:DUF5320 domain-containing protein [Dehalococcoidales bacterium]